MLVLKIVLWYFCAAFVWYVPIVFGQSNLIESSNRKDKNRGDVRRPGIINFFLLPFLMVVLLLAPSPVPSSVLIEVANRRDLRKIGFEFNIEIEVEVDNDGTNAANDRVWNEEAASNNTPTTTNLCVLPNRLEVISVILFIFIRKKL